MTIDVYNGSGLRHTVLGGDDMRAPTFAEIGARVKESREANGLSQGDLAKAVEISRPVISKIENGGKAINSVELRRISDCLGVSVDDLTKPVNDRGLVAFFRDQKQDSRFLESVALIEDLARDMLGQTHLRRKYDGKR